MTRARVAKGMSAEVCVSDTGLVQLSGNPRSDKKKRPRNYQSGKEPVREEVSYTEVRCANERKYM